MTFRTRIPGTSGNEVTFESRTAGQAAVEAVETSLPLVGAGAPIIVGNRRRRRAGVLGTALAQPQDVEPANTDDASAVETPPRR